jgi:predicted  nucleic acid-binding Zn-ribbon protein
MGIPWLTAIKAAEALLSGVTTRRAVAASAQQLQSAADRIAALEKNDEATAQLLVQLAGQIQALTQMLELQSARLRRLTVIAVASAAVAVAALIVALAA